MVTVVVAGRREEAGDGARLAESEMFPGVCVDYAYRQVTGHR